MAKNVFNNNKPTAQVSMNAFDNGQFQTYSMKAGIGLPCFFLHTTPKMKARINVQNYLMAENLRQNAFLRCKQNIDFFFVPYRQLNHQFSPLYYGRDDKQHAFQLGTIPHVPSFNLSKIEWYLFNAYSICRSIVYFMNAQYEYLINKYGTQCPFSSYEGYVDELFDAISTFYQEAEVDDYEIFLNQHLGNWESTFYLMYQHQYSLEQDLAEWKEFDSYQAIQRFVVDHNYNVEDCLRTLDMLGYGNFYSAFKYRYDSVLNTTIYNDGYTSLDDSQFLEDYFGAHDEGFQPYSDKSLVQNLFNVLNQYTPYKGEQDPLVVNAFSLMAYQKIFDNVYRNNVVVPRKKYGWDLVYSFNTDGLSGNILSTFNAGEFCALFLCPWFIQHRRNLSNGLWNSAQFGQQAMAITDQQIQDDHGTSIPDLRMAFAMQTFKERLLRCGDKEKDLLKGLFGVKSRYVGDEYVYYIGSYDGMFNVNTVQDVSGDNLGRLGGNIISSIQGHQLEFSCEDFGVIIGIHSILPTMVYPAFGIDMQNTKHDQFDFYHPDFENLGLQPVLRWSLMSKYFGLSAAQNDVIGYSARFIEYKQKLDVSHGTFSDLDYLDVDISVPHHERGIDSDYVTNFDLTQVGTYEAQYVHPDSLDNIFDTLTDYTIESDHFKTWLNVQCDTLLPMSVIGLPQLN